MEVRLANHHDIGKVVEIHQSRFQNFFLSSLGRIFLYEFYKSFLKNPGLLIVLEDEHEIVGFAAGSHSNRFFFKKLLKNNLFGFVKTGIGLLITKPFAILRLGYNVRKAEKEELHFAELLSIATIPNKKGYGNLLLASFESFLKKSNIELPISLTTDVLNNEKALRFYKNSGYEIYKEFTSYEDRKMYRLIKK